MNAAEFLNELRRSSVRIWLEGEQLRCKAPKGVLTKDVAAKISARKPEIIAYLSRYYDIAAGEAHTSCEWSLMDCNSQGGGYNEGDDMQGFVEVLSISETCIVGTISEGDACDSTTFAVSRCD